MDHHLIRVLHALCVEVATPRALAVKLMSERGEWTQLLKLRVRPSDYADSESYWKDCVVTDFLRKCDIETDVDKEAAAEKTFIDCEVMNASTNARLARFMPGSALLEHPGDERVFRFISEWRKEVSWVLGNLPDHLTPRFSGGATFGDAGLLITTPDKMSSRPTVTQGARCLIPQWSETLWASALVKERPWQSDPLTVRGNKFFTVPKDAEKRRGCCKEPSINVTYQLDVGKVIRGKLLSKLGIDLKEGQDRHRRLAKQASIDGSLATIDMSNASDTLCRLLPALVLREDWHSLLYSLRASHTQFKGRWYRLEKFSSMGNGFTFELETLVFASLARRVVAGEGGDPDSVTCYGDDLIVPSRHCESVLAALRFFGFDPAAEGKKTFSAGPFRESCGGDFFLGKPVRAHFVKEIPDEPQHWIALANGLRRMAHADNSSSSRWAVVRRAWHIALDALPSDIRRLRGPEHLGDLVIHDEEPRWSHTTIRPRQRWSGQRRQGGILVDDGTGPVVDAVYAYVPLPVSIPWNHWSPAVQLASCTLGYPSTGVTPRGGVAGYRIKKLASRLTSNWEPNVR